MVAISLSIRLSGPRIGPVPGRFLPHSPRPRGPRPFSRGRAVQVSFRSNLEAFRRALDETGAREVPFAAARALTDTARDVETNTAKRLPKVFDRPTPFTLRGLFVKPARKARLVATVGFKDKQADYLALQETGGTRRPKGRALVVPASARVNRYGNLPRGAVRRALARPDTFSGTVRGVAGIWQRTRRGGVRLLVAYEDRARYEPRLGFDDGARKTALARFGRHFARRFAEAVETGARR